MNILGLSAFYHESACCLLQGGKLVAAAAEERFSRRKHDPRLPVQAFRFCLEASGIDLTELDAIAYYENPRRKLSRQLWSGPSAAGGSELAWLDAAQPEQAIRERLGFAGPILAYDHHLSHAASAFLLSPFPEAAILTTDGVGEWATTTYGRAEGQTIELFEEVLFPHSLGLLYSTITAYLGFRVNGGEYKVMGLAPYGEPRYIDQLCQLIGMGEDGQFLLNLKYFDFIRGRRMFSQRLCELFGRPQRHPETALEPFHHDVACSLQLLLEEILLEKADYLYRRVGSPNLCMAGGVALNCVANGRLLRESPFERLFVQPAAGDAGAALGAAALAQVELVGDRPRSLEHVFLGPSYSADEIARLLAATGLCAEDYRDREEELLAAVVERLVARRVVAWFHGAMEFGPRALGGRSILADPRNPDARERLNRLVKKREAFRPFAPSVLLEYASEHFALDHASPFMLETCTVRSPLDLPAITHVDGSARPQTVDGHHNRRYAALLAAFHHHTGCPLLVNTSFNVRGQPIVCSPVDALFCLGQSRIDTLVLEDFVIDREELPASWHELLPQWLSGRDRQTISETLYTFV